LRGATGRSYDNELDGIPAKVDRQIMKRKKNGGLARLLEEFSVLATRWAGGSWAFGAAIAVILLWAATGPLFHFSDTWQLVINTGTGLVTFLMVFLIQRAQNKESQAIQLKLNELVAAIAGASNRLIAVESLSEKELDTLRKHFSALAKLAAEEDDFLKSHSVEEAKGRHLSKSKRKGPAPGS